MTEQKNKKRLYDIEYRRKNKEKIKQQKKEWAQNNPEKVEASKIRNRESKKISDKKYSEKNKYKLNLYKKEWAKNNPNKVKKSNLKYHKDKMLNDPLYKLRHKLGCIIRGALKKYVKQGRTIDILGCSYEEFRLYIENLFECWMTWENYGKPKDGVYELNKTWDFDHKIPLNSGSTQEEIIKLCHYTNIQPLCSYFNRFIKKDNI